MTGVARFNTKPKAGLAFLEENGLIGENVPPGVSKDMSIARFLKSCTGIDKRQLGDYISKPDHIEILKAFMGLFDFKDVGHPLISLYATFLARRCTETHRRSFARDA